MSIKWSDTRNWASVELIKNELFVHFNCSLTRTDRFLVEKKQLLKAAKSSFKYYMTFSVSAYEKLMTNLYLDNQSLYNAFISQKWRLASQKWTLIT